MPRKNKIFLKKVFLALIFLFIADKIILRQAAAWTECWGPSSWQYYCSGNNIYARGERQCFVYQRVCFMGFCYDQCVWSYTSVITSFVAACNQTQYTDWGPKYCKNDDLYHKRSYTSTYCSGGRCAWRPWQTQEQLAQDCGTDSYGAWGKDYCKNNNIYHSRTFTERGCLNGKCTVATSNQEALVRPCAAGTTCINTATGAICEAPVVSFIDIGLRVFDGTATVAIAAWPLAEAGKSPLKIVARDGNVYGIALVDPSDPNATKVRINTGSGIKALRKYP